MSPLVLPVASSLAALPLSALVGIGVLLVAVSLFASRVLANVFRGSAPPVDEGIPFVGGLVKFSKVRGAACFT